MDCDIRLVVPDIHVPFHCPKYMDVLEQAILGIRGLKGIVSLGDGLDCWEISSHDKNPKRKMQLVDDIRLYNQEILDRWEGLEKTGQESKGVCPCGGASISPTNLTPEERADLEGWWQGFRYFILKRDDHRTRIWKLWDKEVRGK